VRKSVAAKTLFFLVLAATLEKENYVDALAALTVASKATGSNEACLMGQ